MTGPLQPPSFMGNPTTDHSARGDRLSILGAMFRPAGVATPVASIGGALWGPAGTMGELTLVNPTTIRMAAARFAIPSTLGPSEGIYEVINQSPYDIPVPPQDVAQYRRGYIGVWVRDAFASGSGTDNDWTAQVIPGPLAASNPQLPTVLPANLLITGEVSIPPVGGTVTITPYNPRTVLRGQTLPVADQAARLAIPADQLFPGFEVEELDTGRVYKRTANDWAILMGSTPWTNVSTAELTTANGWSPLGGGWPTARYRREAGDSLRIQATLQGRTAAQDQLVFTLPAGLIPSTNTYILATTGGTTEPGNTQVGPFLQLVVYGLNDASRAGRVVVGAPVAAGVMRFLNVNGTIPLG